MAQTKKRSTATRTRSGSQKRSNSAKSKAAKPAAKSNGGGSSKSRSRIGSSQHGVEAVRSTVEDKAKSAGQTVGRAASKAKLPLVAGGAALAGAAGGLALASRQGRKASIAGLGLRKPAALRKPTIKIKSGDVARVAKEVGNFSTQMGALASELERNREQAGNGKRRSPIEVALHGLTSRG